jgi:TPP-dependent pyruvate/acetoin dehydrogenase alpha subunit
VPKYERTLLEAGIIDEAQLAALKADVLRETNEATDAAEALPLPAPSDLYTHVYAGSHEPWQ